MEKEALRIVYMGTPEFAVEPLKTLVNDGYNVVAVITMPDKPSGRGMKLQSSDVKQYAMSVNIPVLQPEKLKDENFLNDLRSFNADLQIVVAFRMLPEVVWSMPRMGTFNLHASLLPQYRGAAPIHHAVINGEKETGVTTFFLKQDIDTGDIIYQEKISIGENECTGSVHDRLMTLGSKLVKKTVDAVLNGDVVKIPQVVLTNDSELKPAPKLTRDNTRIDWSKNGMIIFNFIRGLSPYPAAWTELYDSEGGSSGLKIYDSAFYKVDHNLAPGFIISDGKNELNVAVTDGFIFLKRLQLAGRKVLNTDEFLRGFSGIAKNFVR
jgi:methionyl-tRNA formyltransferase